MPRGGNPGVPAGSCRECGHTWTALSLKEPCPSCGSLNVTISVPKKQQEKRREF